MVTEKLVFWEGTLLCGHWLKTDRNVLLCSASGRCLRWWVHLIACPRLAGSKTSVGIEPLRLSNDAQRCWGLNGVSPHGHVSMAPSSTGAGAHYAWHPGWLMNTISGPQCDLTHIYNHTHTHSHTQFSQPLCMLGGLGYFSVLFRIIWRCFSARTDEVLMTFYTKGSHTGPQFIHCIYWGYTIEQGRSCGT